MSLSGTTFTDCPPGLGNDHPVIADERIGGDKQCFYCGQPVGHQHALGCVMRRKRVRVQVTIEMEIERPEDWDASNVEFHLNDSSWCCDNIVEELDKFVNLLDERGECLCGYMKAVCLPEEAS